MPINIRNTYNYFVLSSFIVNNNYRLIPSSIDIRVNKAINLRKYANLYNLRSVHDYQFNMILFNS